MMPVDEAVEILADEATVEYRCPLCGRRTTMSLELACQGKSPKCYEHGDVEMRPILVYG
jgi:predicted RNA-binding Zn-ribbon protein involved in translation (DUF1610 family)